MIKFARSSHDENHGFTLVEIMITLTLLSMILVLLFGSLHTVNLNWQTGTQKIEKNDEIRHVGQFIRKLLTQAVPLMWINRDGQRLVFNGDHEELTFTSTLPSHRGGGGLYLINLKAVDADGSKGLDLLYQRASPESYPFGSGSFDNQTRVPLANNVEKIEFSYFGRSEPGNEQKWHNNWKSEQVLPKLVQVKIQSSDPEQHWPIMNIAILPVPIKGKTQYIVQD